MSRETNEQVQVSCNQFNNQQMDTKLKTRSLSLTDVGVDVGVPEGVLVGVDVGV